MTNFYQENLFRKEKLREAP